MKIYKYIAIGAVATFAWSAAQAYEKETREGIEASGGFGFNEKSGSESGSDTSQH